MFQSVHKWWKSKIGHLIICDIIFNTFLSHFITVSEGLQDLFELIKFAEFMKFRKGLSAPSIKFALHGSVNQPSVI